MSPLGWYAADWTPEGLTVFQALMRFEKSGLIGVGVPDLEYPPAGAAESSASTLPPP